MKYLNGITWYNLHLMLFAPHFVPSRAPSHFALPHFAPQHFAIQIHYVLQWQSSVALIHRPIILLSFVYHYLSKTSVIELIINKQTDCNFFWNWPFTNFRILGHQLLQALQRVYTIVEIVVVVVVEVVVVVVVVIVVVVVVVVLVVVSIRTNINTKELLMR